MVREAFTPNAGEALLATARLVAGVAQAGRASGRAGDGTGGVYHFALALGVVTAVGVEWVAVVDRKAQIRRVRCVLCIRPQVKLADTTLTDVAGAPITCAAQAPALTLLRGLPDANVAARAIDGVRTAVTGFAASCRLAAGFDARLISRE